MPSRATDLIFCQNVLMWVPDAHHAMAGLAQALQPGGVLVAIEPDYGGMIEHPPEVALRDIWLKALHDAGADPCIGRKLPASCEAAGLDTWVELQNIPRPPTSAATQLLLDLPLSDHDKARAREVARAIEQCAGTWTAFIHVPYLLVVATRP